MDEKRAAVAGLLRSDELPGVLLRTERLLDWELDDRLHWVPGGDHWLVLALTGPDAFGDLVGCEPLVSV